MKKILFILAALLTVTFTSCDKDDERDKFEGTYRIELSGSVTYDDYMHTTNPIHDVGSITITKASLFGNVVNVSGYFNAEATISGNRIQIGAETISKEMGNKVITYTYYHREGTLNGNTITFDTEIDGIEEQVVGSSREFYGLIHSVAVK